MIRLIIFSLLVCVAGVVLMMSNDAQDGADNPDPASTQIQMADSSWYAGTHILERSADGHFYANMEVNGTTMRLLVDTGASVVALTGSDALDAGITWNSDDIAPVGSGANGAVFGVPILIESIELEGMVQRNVPAVIIPEGLEISLLGQSFLSNITSVEIEDGQMALKDD